MDMAVFLQPDDAAAGMHSPLIQRQVCKPTVIIIAQTVRNDSIPQGVCIMR